jgi:glycosyltransferase involved in cell wall biosynthesis
MAKHKVSVIVPNFNNKKYLEECVTSIQSQSFSNLEILIIDDASLDGSRDIIAGLSSQDKRIRVILNDSNVGISSNRQKGILAADGDYITTIDSDDYLMHPQKIELEYRTITSHPGEDVIAFSGFVLVNAKGRPLDGQGAEKVVEGDIFKCVITRTCMIPRDYMFSRKQFVEAGGLNPGLKMYEDWDLKIRMSRLYKFYFTGIDGVAYRRHGQGLSSVKRPVHYKWINRVYNINRKRFAGDISEDMENQYRAFVSRNYTLADRLLSVIL